MLVSRERISEFRAKKLIFDALGLGYEGRQVDCSKDYAPDINALDITKKYVVKVDQAIKKRNKLGLVFVAIQHDQIRAYLEIIRTKGYRWALIEPHISHKKSAEKFISIARVANGLSVIYSERGGVDVEENIGTAKIFIVQENDISSAESYLDSKFLGPLIGLMEKAHVATLEINPFIIKDAQLYALDAAVEVDGAAELIVGNIWSSNDFRQYKKVQHTAELRVEEIASKSPASLSLKVLNPDGSIFALLSGGGASVVISDEISKIGLQNVMANYGEYSGNPNEEETYSYTEQVVELMLSSSSKKKVMIIAGGVANFTDVSKTFEGIIRALDDKKDEIKKQEIYIIVRRGGPNEEKGLSAIRLFLDKSGIKHDVYGSDFPLSGIAPKVAMELKND